MRAEIAKLRFLPLPRFVAAAAFVVALVPGALLLVFQPTTEALYTTSSTLTNAMIIEVLAIIVGTWVATLEFGAGTLQRTLTAESDRNRVLLSKLTVAIGFVIVLAVGAAAVNGGLVDLASDRAGYEDSNELLRGLLSSAPTTLSGVLIGFGFGLLTRSFGGGITLGVVFAYVLQGFVTFIPGVKNWFYSVFLGDISSRIAGGTAATDATSGHAFGVSLVGALVWMVAVVAPGWLMFSRGDLK